MTIFETSFDLNRLALYEEELFGLDFELVWPVIQSFLQHCKKESQEKGALTVASEKEQKELQISLDGTNDSLFYYIARDSSTPTYILSNLLRRPRILKQALRKTYFAWQTLHGEVSLNELLVFNTIRTISSEAVSYIRDNYFILNHESDNESTQDKEKRNETLKTAWKEGVKIAEGDKDNVWRLITFLFPWLGSSWGQGEKRTQGMMIDERYKNRILSGRINRHDVRDQEVIKVAKSWKESHDLETLPNRLYTEKPFTDVFEMLFEYAQPAGIYITGDDVLTLTSSLLERVRNDYGVKANIAIHIPDICPGLIPLWRLSSKKQMTNDYAGWLWKEIELAFPVSLQLQNAIEYWWASDRSPATDEIRKNIRKDTAKWAKEYLNSDEMCRLLNDVPLPNLLWLISGPPHNAHNPEPKWEQWDWIGERIIEALKKCPNTMIPQAACLVSKSGQRLKHDEEDDGHSRNIENVYSANNQWIESFFPGEVQRRDFIKLLLQPTPHEEDWDPEIKKCVNEVRTDLKKNK